MKTGDNNSNNKSSNMTGGVATMRNESIGTLDGDQITRTSVRSLSENTYDNFLQIDQEDATKILSNRNLRASARTNERQARRNSIMKSLAVLDIDDEETDLFPNPESTSFNSECESVSGSISSCGSESSAAKQRRYLRRGSVTKHKFEAEVNGLQPNSLSLQLTTSAEDEGVGGYANGGDYGSDNSDTELQRKRRYLRRGSVTKYSLDAHVSKIQPTSIMENKANNPRRTLPPPPKPTSNRSVHSEATTSASSSSGSGSGSRPPMAPSHASSQSPRPPSSANPNDASDSGHAVRRRLKSSSTSSSSSISSASKSKNLDDSGHRRKSKNLEDSDHSTTLKSKNLDDSGHKKGGSLSESEPESTNLDDSVHKKKASSSSSSTKSKNLDDSGHKGAATKSKSTFKSNSVASNSEKRSSSSSKSNKTKMTIGDSVGGSHALGRSSIWIKTHSTSSVSSEDSEEFASTSASYPTETKKTPPPSTEKLTSLVARKVRGSSFNKSRLSNSNPANLKTAPISPSKALFSPSGKRIKSILSHGPHKKQSEFKKSVRFGDLVITEFPIILGDNPAVTMGAPVTIDWEAQGEITYKINVYESIRGTRRRRRKLLISVSNRAILLLAAGYSIDDIADASINAQQIKFGRQESMQNQAWDRVNMMMETSRGAVGSVGTLMLEGTVGTVGTIMGGTVGTVGTLMGGTVGSVGTLMGDTGKKIRAIVKPMRVSESARSA
jgi:hypothetical protein